MVNGMRIFCIFDLEYLKLYGLTEETKEHIISIFYENQNNFRFEVNKHSIIIIPRNQIDLLGAIYILTKHYDLVME